MKIVAEGTINGRKSTVTVQGSGEKLEFLFNGKPNENLQKSFFLRLEMRYHIGNYEPDVFEGLNIVNVLAEHYCFDEKPKITKEGVDDLPNEQGLIY